MAAEVEIDLGDFDALLGSAAMEAAQDEMSHHWRDLMEPHVPKETGALRENVTVDGQEITYTEDYAVYVYNMDENVNWSTGGTGPHWNESAKAESLGDLEEHMAGFILRGGE